MHIIQLLNQQINKINVYKKFHLLVYSLFFIKNSILKYWVSVLTMYKFILFHIQCMQKNLYNIVKEISKGFMKNDFIIIICNSILDAHLCLLRGAKALHQRLPRQILAAICEGERVQGLIVIVDLWVDGCQ